MFRPLRRTKRAITDEDARELLHKEKRGIFAVNGDDGYPFAIPVDYYYDEDAGKIYFHGAKCGHKVDSLRKDDKVCFTVYGGEFYKEDDWAPYLRSVVIFGRCRMIDELSEVTNRVRTLAEKYYPSEDEIDAEINKDIHGVMLYEITIEHMCGKQIHEK